MPSTDLSQDALARLAAVIETRKAANGGDDLTPGHVVAELARRAGTSGIEEKALRKAVLRDAQGG